MLVKTFAIDHSGRGIAKVNGKIVFIKKALDNEEVEINLIDDKKNYAVGEVSKVIVKNIKRQKSICPYFAKCGGCDFLNLEYEAQLKYKYDKVVNIFKKYTDIDVIVNDVVENVDNLYYRNKATFKVDDKIGFYKEGTHDIIDIDTCYIVDKKINFILKIFREQINCDGICELVVRCSRYTNEIMVIIKIEKEIQLSSIVEKLHDLVDALFVKKNNTYRKIFGKDYIVENLGDMRFIISPSSFFQVNTDMALKLYEGILNVADLKGDENILDLYCGTGTIGLFLAKHCKYVLGSEINAAAISDANYNKRLNGITNIDFIVADGLKKIINKEFDVVVVDPPRSGLDKLTIRNIIALKPKKIIYTSCDVITLVRDINLLKEFYKIVSVTPFDLFSNTHHIECVCMMHRLDI